MPKTTITHEPWCAEHNGPEVGLPQTCCSKGVQFGPLMPRRRDDIEIEIENDTRGSLYVQFAEAEPEAVAMLEWAPHFGQLDLQALRAVRHAIADDPKGFLYAIDKTLCAIDADVTA